MVFSGRGLLKLFDDWLPELHDLSALKADKMIVVLGRSGFVAAELIVEPVFFDEAFFLEGVESPVDCRQANPRCLGADERVDFLGAQMSLGFGEGLEDTQALLRRVNS